MPNRQTLRVIFLFLVSIGHGLLLAWILTLDGEGSTQFLAAFSILALLLVFHYASTRLLGQSIFWIDSYPEGILFFTMTMAAFRIGDHLIDITDLSLRSEILWLGFGAVSGIIYVWALRLMNPKR